MAVLWEQLGSELSLFRAHQWTCTWNETLHYARTEIHYNADDASHRPHDDDHFLHDLLMKMLRCGRRPNCTYPVESLIVETYGGPYKIKKRPSQIGQVVYKCDPKLEQQYRSFTDVLDPWTGDLDEIEFDPEHPDNERKFFDNLVKKVGPRMAHCIQPQVAFESVLPHEHARSFHGQRGDFLLSFPSGQMLLLEPGDHDEKSQQNLDGQRDDVFQKSLNCRTRRYRNEEISDPETYDRLEKYLADQGLLPFVGKTDSKRSNDELAQNYLFLLPSLITRIERLLAEFFFRRGLFNYDVITLAILERDLECAEVALFSFLDRVQRLMALYGIEGDLPRVRLQIQRNKAYRYGDLAQIKGRLEEVSPGIVVEEVDQIDGESATLFLDVAIKCNALTVSHYSGATLEGFVRQGFPHNHVETFQYRSVPRAIAVSEQTTTLLEGFLQDFFRKEALRPGQPPIVENILKQVSTIGLLPTSAGKSICYQLASLLTPGLTFVVDPLVALMEDQVQGLKGDHGIDRVFALHAGSGIRGDQVGKILGQSIMIFLAPERFQNPDFRMSMQSLNALDLFVNYAVIDEAHCVSMWGHDFRPPYLLLEKNLRKYCSFRGQEPVIVALTGTASQMVLIDLQRELNIQNSSNIVRPKTFDRPELSFQLHKCPANRKQHDLDLIDQKIRSHLNVNDLYQEADGIVFVPTVNGRSGCWAIFGQHVSEPEDHVWKVVQAADDSVQPFGIYTGTAPKNTNFTAEDWQCYKRITLENFKRGRVKRLFGTTAVSVGIDNPHLNYVINYSIPASLEQFVQQSGRAGRSGQESICVLMASNGNLRETREWLEGGIDQVSSNRWDDIGTLSFFHRGSFPGNEVDIQGLKRVLDVVLDAEVLDSGYREIPQYFTEGMEYDIAERTERYLCYLLILNVIDDYQSLGMNRNRRFQFKFSPEFEDAWMEENENSLANSVVSGLFRYRQRYLVQDRNEIWSDYENSGEEWQDWAVKSLINFVYEHIEYRRREQMLTMVNFCEEEDTSPATLRRRIRLYFDGNPKFSPALEAMRNREIPMPDDLEAIISKVQNYEDVDSLIWGARSLLDENFHLGWAAIYLYATVYRSMGQSTPEFERVSADLIRNWETLSAKDQHRDECQKFMGCYLSMLIQLESHLGKASAERLYQLVLNMIVDVSEGDFEKLSLINFMKVEPVVQDRLHLHFVHDQVREICDVANSYRAG